MTTPTPERDDSQVALRIATRSAFLTTTLYIALFALSKALPSLESFPYFEPAAKVVLVLVALMAMGSYIEEAKKVASPENIPFLSTVFFYGITLLLVYLAQIGYLVAQTVLGNPSSFVDKVEFLLGVDSFGTRAIISSVIAGHLPFLAYYVMLARQVRRYVG